MFHVKQLRFCPNCRTDNVACRGCLWCKAIETNRARRDQSATARVTVSMASCRCDRVQKKTEKRAGRAEITYSSGIRRYD